MRDLIYYDTWKIILTFGGPVTMIPNGWYGI